MRVVFDRIRPKHAPDLVALHRAVFPAEQVARTIYGSERAADYLATVLSFPALQGDGAFWGAWAEERLVGYVQCRMLADSYHLNHIAVHPDHQGAGVGTGLWRLFVESAQEQGMNRLTLDVDQTNQSALCWYSRNGFKVASTSGLYEKSLEPGTSPEPGGLQIRLLDWAESEACQRAYGFSRFKLAEGDRNWIIGRLGSAYFRIEEPVSPGIETALSLIDPSRRLLLSNRVTPQNHGYRQVAVSYRMRKDL